MLFDFIDINKFVDVLLHSDIKFARKLMDLLDDIEVSREFSDLLEPQHSTWKKWLEKIYRGSLSTEAIGEQNIRNFVKVLNGIFKRQEIYDDNTYTLGLISKEYGYSEKYKSFFNREAFDKIFPKLIKPGNRLELVDGLWPVEEFVNIIPSHYEVVIDLATCNSIFMGEGIKHKCRCIVVVNKYTTTFTFKALLYR